MSKISSRLLINALQPDTLLSDIISLCKEATLYKYASISVPPPFVVKAKEILQQADTKVATVIGYPYGYNAIESKLAEILLAIVDGVDEICMTASTTAIKNNDWQYVASEINTINPIVKRKGKSLTIILESVLLNDEEIIKACDIYGAAGVDFLQAGTGIIEVERNDNISLIRKHLADPVRIIATDNNPSYKLIKEYINEGADRVGIRDGLKLMLEESALN